MNKLATLLCIFAVCMAPIQAQVTATRIIRTDSVQRPLLSQLRKANVKKYTEVKKQERMMVKRTEARYRFRECIPCDTRFVAQLLSKQEELTRSEIKSLICTYRLQCRDNAEFMEIFNELVHKVVEQNPQGFFDQYEAPEQSQFREALDQVIMNPVRDNVDTRSILQTIRGRVQEKRTKSTRAASVYSTNLLESLESRLQADIENKRRDRIRRLQLRQE